MNGMKDCERCVYFYSSDYLHTPECHNPYLTRIREKHRPDPYNCEFCDEKTDNYLHDVGLDEEGV